MIVKKAKPLAIECIVRGYLSGSRLEGIQEIADRLRHQTARRPDRIRRTAGTDFHAVHQGRGRPRRKHFVRRRRSKIVGAELATQARDLSLKIYQAGRDYARQRGIIIADTKFEFGLSDGKLILIDEVMTPDSSRFWPADQYQPGRGQPSFDKQFVRDYLETLDWNKTPPGPKLPADVVAKTSAKYLEAYERLTGKKFE